MSSADAAIGWVADNYLGTGEPYPPKGGEWIPFQEEFGYPAGMEVEWCGGLWMKAIRATGGTIGPNGTVPNCWYTVAGVQEFMRRGDWYPADGNNSPQRGDLVFFTWNGSGFITEPSQANNSTVMHVEGVVDPAQHQVDGSILTYGGNVNERCGMFRRYDDTSMVGFGRPRWSAPVVVPSTPPAIGVIGDIGKRWHAIGGVNSIVGKPVENEKPLIGATRIQRFERGVIAWGPQTGAWEIYGGILQRWSADGGKQVGMPLGPEGPGPIPGSRWQRFTTGYLVWSPTTGARVLKGAILMEYLKLPQEQKNRLGVLTSDERDAKVSLFQNGTIAWEKSASAWTNIR